MRKVNFEMFDIFMKIYGTTRFTRELRRFIFSSQILIIK